MINVLASGCNGRMGQLICRMIENEFDMQVTCGFDNGDYNITNQLFPVHKCLSKITEPIDAIIDFSSPLATRELLGFACDIKCPMVIGTTGITTEDMERMKEVSKKIPIFYSANMSYTVAVFRHLAEIAAPLLEHEYDIEICEIHHRGKSDSPSGTAKMIAESINESVGNSMQITYGRNDKRQSNEIGITSLRGGGVCGIHEVHFLGQSDSIQLTHTAYDRSSFAEGAIKATKFVASKEIISGLYGMGDLF